MSAAAATCRQTLWIGDDQNVAGWVKERIRHISDFGDCTAFGILQDGKPAGGVVFNNYRGFDIHMSAALEVALTRQNLRTLCEYAFGQLNVRRVTAITGKKNRGARKALRIIGFVEEGTAKYALDGTNDAVQYGLLRENCRFLKHG